MIQVLVAFVAGAVFALGLGTSGMTRPAKVLAFLDIAGDWDPSLALVMIGAIAVHAPLGRLVRRRGAPLLARRFRLPVRHEIDLPLIGGAALFGIGWGLAGYCPGPAITSLASGNPTVVIFVAAMFAGMVMHALVFERSAPAPAPAGGEPAALRPGDARSE